jgi:hypothetical protein
MIEQLPSRPASAVVAPLQPLPILALAATLALLLAAVPWLWPLAYPLRLLVTIVHELSHGLAGLLTGGHFDRFVIFPDGSGTAYVAGGWKLLIAPAGYLGSAAFAAGMITIGRSPRWSRRVLQALGALVLALSLRYGIPSIFSTQALGGLVAVVSGVLLGLGFLWAGRRASPAAALFLVNLTAFQAGLNACSDLLTLMGVSSQFSGLGQSDAQAMAALTFVPALIWAALWGLIAVLLIGGSLWRTWLRPGAR